jgi:D-arabinose 1-dehydrogenase-like Zn-dependent alcohol dehydrogenase
MRAVAIHSLPVDLKHICQNLNQFGYGKGTKHGGLSDYTIIPARYAYLLKTDLEDAKAAILERTLL